MLALTKAKAGEGLWLEDVPEPEIGINDVLIRVRKTGICGTDLHIYDWDERARRFPYRWSSATSSSGTSSDSAPT
jgi:threonine 3-dehydrogenase